MERRNEAARRMEDPANCVVECFVLGEGLMTALVRDDPKTSGEEANPKPIQRPEREASERVEDREG